MTDLLALEVVTPERLLVREEVATVQAPAKNGYLGVLPGHAPLLAELGTGALYYEGGGRRHYVAVHGGFLEVLQDRVRVLADTAERAEEQVFHPAPDVDPAIALGAMARAQARIDAAAQKAPA